MATRHEWSIAEIERCVELLNDEAHCNPDHVIQRLAGMASDIITSLCPACHSRSVSEVAD